MNKEFIEILRQMKEIHNKKAEDYTTNPDIDPYENFERTNIIASWFPYQYKSFVVLIGTKLARLASLLAKTEKGFKPNNESINDSFLDLSTYCVLWASYYKERWADSSPQPKLENFKFCISHDFYHGDCIPCQRLNRTQI